MRLIDPKGAMSPWDGETSDYLPGTPEYEEEQTRREAEHDRMLAEHGVARTGGLPDA